MRIVVQRVRSASVSVDGAEIACIGPGLVVFVAFGADDTAERIAPMAHKLAELRIFAGADGRFQHSLRQVKGEALVVPNFTLYGDTRRGRRPEFVRAMASQRAETLFDHFVEALAGSGIERVAAGRFGAYMQIRVENDGPVTLILED